MGGRTLPQTLGTSHACQNTSSQYSGTLSEKEVHWHPERGYYSGVLGKHIGSLSGPSNANFDLYLAMWDDLEKKWKFIAHSVPDPSRPSTEDIDYNGSYGYYSWGVYARSGSGSYHLSVCSPLE
jgi:streptogrisin C